MSALPLAKLGGLLIKTLAKPTSKSLKAYARSHPSMSSLLRATGEASHQATARLSIASAGPFKVKSVPPLDAGKATERGAEILGEGFILLVGSAITVAEYARSAKAAKEKAAKRAAELDAVDEDLQTRLLVLERRCAQLEGKVKGSFGRGGGVEEVREEEARREVRERRRNKAPKAAPKPEAPAEKARVNAFGIDTSVYGEGEGGVPDGGDIAARIQARLKGRGKGEKGGGRRVEEREAFEYEPERGEERAGWREWARGALESVKGWSGGGPKT